jgi:hypothetical protein
VLIPIVAPETSDEEPVHILSSSSSDSDSESDGSDAEADDDEPPSGKGGSDDEGSESSSTTTSGNTSSYSDDDSGNDDFPSASDNAAESCVCVVPPTTPVNSTVSSFSRGCGAGKATTVPPLALMAFNNHPNVAMVRWSNSATDDSTVGNPRQGTMSAISSWVSDCCFFMQYTSSYEAGINKSGVISGLDFQRLRKATRESYACFPSGSGSGDQDIRDLLPGRWHPEDTYKGIIYASEVVIMPDDVYLIAAFARCLFGVLEYRIAGTLFGIPESLCTLESVGFQEKQRDAHDEWLAAQYRRIQASQQRAAAIQEGTEQNPTQIMYCCEGYPQPEGSQCEGRGAEVGAAAIQEGTEQNPTQFMYCCEGYPQPKGSQCEGCGAEVGVGLPIEFPEIFEFEGGEGESAGQQPREKFP